VSPDFTVGNNYIINDGGDYWLGWNGGFKAQVRTYSSGTDTAYFTPIASKKVGSVIYYQWKISGSPDCLEYDGSTTAVIADTCTSSRSSQWWWWASTSTDAFYNLYNGDFMWAAGIGSNEPVYCESSEPYGNQDIWNFTSF
jgi:hypothetical protein